MNLRDVHQDVRARYAALLDGQSVVHSKEFVQRHVTDDKRCLNVLGGNCSIQAVHKCSTIENVHRLSESYRDPC